jgi:hypothetical protein
MVKDHKPSRRGADRGTATTKPGASRSCASSPSARSTVSRSKAERSPLKAVRKLHKGLVGQSLFFISSLEPCCNLVFYLISTLMSHLADVRF